MGHSAENDRNKDTRNVAEDIKLNGNKEDAGLVGVKEVSTESGITDCDGPFFKLYLAGLI